MATQPKQKLTVAEYLVKFEGAAAGRYELADGDVIMMPPETVLHNRTKGRIFAALDDAITSAGLPCTVFTGGMTIKIDEFTAREPDAVVQCGGKIDDTSLLVEAPLIVIEVVSPSSERDDTGRKFVEYFSIASIRHYVVVDPWKRVVVHHWREGDDKIQTRILGSGDIEFLPPGFAVTVAQLLGAR